MTVIEGSHAGEKALYIDGRIRVASGSAWADEINDNDNSIVMFKPVSYTHLDVYKRQY